MDKKIYIFALAATGQGISGGDRIFIEFARRWSKIFLVTICVWEEGYQMCKRQHLDSQVKFLISKMDSWRKLGFMINYFARIVEGIRIGLTLKIEDPDQTIIYSASDFWMDVLPALILKLRYSKIKWTAAWYQTAPKPWRGFAEGARDNRYYRLALIYWLMQLPIHALVDRIADFVLVNNNSEKKYFRRLFKLGKTIVVLGAVNLSEIKRWKDKFKFLPKIYDGVFQGRFHPQKGVEELIDIWKMVVKKRKDAKLVMIGDGPLMDRVKSKIKKEKLEKNVSLTGYLFDGKEKYRIFSQSKLVLHPSFYDSGGMAAAEVMAFGLPCVGFDLDSYKFYYPKGMLKAPLGDLGAFSEKILALLSNKNLYNDISKQASQLISSNWSWDFRARQILKRVLE